MTALVDPRGVDAAELVRWLREQGDSDVVVSDAAHPAGVAYVDVWTPPCSPWVAALRAAGTRISSVAELLLDEWPGQIVAVTGTAGKTTTTSAIAQLLQAAGRSVVASKASRFRNMWPTVELLRRTRSAGPDDLLVVELTSSHLAFCTKARADVAVLTNFWPDHLELHGSLEAYRRAKALLFEQAGVVVCDPADTAALAVLGGRSPEVVPEDIPWFLPGAPWAGALRRSVAIALAGALAAGASAEAAEAAVPSVVLPPHRAQVVGDVGGVPVVDDGMAATPAKAKATLEGFPDQSVVLIVGGLRGLESGEVHASAAEGELLASACLTVARVARRVVAFGSAAERIGPLLPEATVCSTLEEATRVACSHARGAEAVVFSPLFPVAAADRSRFAALAMRHSTR